MGTVYADSTMASAPQISTSTSDTTSFVNLMDALLINGFGAYTPPPGWQTAFSAAGQRAYRSSIGRRCYIAFDETLPGTNNTTAKAVGVRAYESMSNVTTGINMFPNVSQSTNFYWYLRNGVAASNWFFIGNSVFFYFVANMTANSCVIQCFGEFPSLAPGYLYNTVLTGAPSGTSFASGYFSAFSSQSFGNVGGAVSANNGSIFVNRDYSGNTVSVSAMSNVIGTSGTRVNSSAETGVIDSLTNKGLLFQNYIIGSTNSGWPQIIGRFPNAWSLLSNASLTSSQVAIGDYGISSSYDLNSRFYCFYGSSSYTGNSFLEHGAVGDL